MLNGKAKQWYIFNRAIHKLDYNCFTQVKGWVQDLVTCYLTLVQLILKLSSTKIREQAGDSLTTMHFRAKQMLRIQSSSVLDSDTFKKVRIVLLKICNLSNKPLESVTWVMKMENVWFEQMFQLKHLERHIHSPMCVFIFKWPGWPWLSMKQILVNRHTQMQNSFGCVLTSAYFPLDWACWNKQTKNSKIHKVLDRFQNFIWI